MHLCSAVRGLSLARTSVALAARATERISWRANILKYKLAAVDRASGEVSKQR
jgi:hypothetical protein